MIDANPEPDIRWIHRFTNDIHQEMDLSRQFNQGYSNNNNRRDGPIWSITQEKINATRWKTNLFIKVNQSFDFILIQTFVFFSSFQHIPKRFFNSNFICRATNRHGQDERSITIIQNHHNHAKKHRHTTTTTSSTTITVDFDKQDNEGKYQSSSTTRRISIS